MTTRTDTRSTSGTLPTIARAHTGFESPSSEAIVVANTKAAPPQRTCRRCNKSSWRSDIGACSLAGLPTNSITRAELSSAVVDVGYETAARHTVKARATLGARYPVMLDD